ncbi:MAG: hypothetical protein H6807_09945 [Planctomycetes bacterium]|nr:hypothetical protein [Planctomycetota bacterium]
MSRIIVACLLLAGSFAIGASAQTRHETLEFKSGRRLSGDVIEVEDEAFLIERRIGKGVAREKVAFADLEPGSLYAVMVSALSPLDRESHRRIADVAFGAELYPTARRHYLASVPAESTPLGSLAERIRDCEARDIARLIGRAEEELDKENFEAARRQALLVMRRYPEREEAATIPARLEEINRRYEAARRRDLALERSRRERSVYEKAEKELDKLVGGLAAAENHERLALRGSDHFRNSLGRFERGLKQLDLVEREVVELRQSSILPPELRARLNQIENDLIALQIRLRLHVASLYTVRGSFGTALAWTNEALAYDPTDGQALESRGRIEQAAAAASARVISRQR